MSTAVKIFLGLSALWAAIALAYQVGAARGGGRTDYGARAGSSLRGILFNFTRGMSPAHKESVSQHPFKFAVGVVMHLGVIFALLAVLMLLVAPAVGEAALGIGWPLLALSLVSGLYLFVRRPLSADLKAMSAPDDYLAILVSCGLLAVSLLYALDRVSPAAFLIYAAVLFLYLPLGKLRHAVFFFVARSDLGRRLGYRGVYPPAAAGRG
ncbi:MAG TPA: hypothetical protein VLC48_10005 [Gemmatimonadota bacterium]|nr:hypothetical protein [Gemmatimonadota bacterium]